jgi:4'-phosphopantetheinyl transferase
MNAPGETGRARPCAGVTVHRFDLDSPAISDDWARPLLTAEERARADGFARIEDRRRRLVAQALLQTILGAVVDRPPTDLVLEAGTHGKPRLRDGGPAFNMSHSGGRLLIAVSEAGEVGVDLELSGLKRDLDAVARYAFSTEDLGALEASSAAERERGILRIWTAKEAALKALGVGLQRPMRELRLSAEAFATLAAPAWTPGSATLDDNSFELHDVSADGDVACLALLAQPGGANSEG